MSVSLLDAMLPPHSSVARRSIEKDDGIKRLRFARLGMKFALETVDALLEPKFIRLDALIKNFGCQITALQNKRIVEKGDVIKEAKRIRHLLSQKIEEYSGYVESDIKGFTLSQLDIEVSADMAQLARFRMLCIVNDNKPSSYNPERAAPFTNCKPIFAMDEKLKPLIKNWVSEIQAEESEKAAAFIKQEVALLEGPRAPILKRLLDTQYMRTTAKMGIVSLPLVYNTEAVFRRAQGIVLIKQILSFCGTPIDAPNFKLFLDQSKNKILDEQEIAMLDPKTPILVVEGYVKCALKVAEVGLYTILMANCANCDQYASGTDQSILGDEEADREIAQYKAMKEIVDEVFEMDHVYLASVGEEQ